MVIYERLSIGFVLLYVHKKSNKRQSNLLGVWVREVGGNLLSQIDKTADRLFADRVVLPVTAAMRWSFEMGIGDESDKALFDFIVRVREGFGIADRCICSQLRIARFRVTISVKEFQVTANCPKGRLFEIDSQERWNAAITKLITKERELIR